MRIISKFKDYYDFASAYGFDPDRTYARKTQEVTPEKEFKHFGSRYYDGRYQAIGFCGDIYPFVNLFCINLLTCRYNTELRKEIVIHGEDCVYYCLSNSKDVIPLEQSQEELLKFIRKNKECTKEKKKGKYARYSNYKNYWRPSSSYDDIKNSSILKEIFLKYKVPIFYIYDNKNIVLNPPLNKLLFQNVMEPHKAFQEIEMFMSNKLYNIEVDKIDRTDLQIRDQKGFNKKSFRKEKG